ncbi:MAG: hypothetical protein OEU76_04890 [Cyclobacteriaceae bacterium]|nr:hypothetical protein [Cyclobacteriaceae bacterium]
METEIDDSLIQTCLRKIESQLGWGFGDEWSTQDFESLSKKIHDATGVTLSVATLKRLWGKVRYDSKPTVTTLNALAQFLGFENWRSFKQTHSINGKSNGHSIRNGVPTHPVASKKGTLMLWILSLVSIFIGIISYYLLYKSDKTELNLSQFQFSSKKVVDSGVPNTVVFDYDASAADMDDSIFIQQSWDKRLSTQVDRVQHQHTSIYYYPGFFAAKLRINEVVVKEHNLIINTEGWIPLIEQEPVPVYFTEADGIRNGVMGLTIDQIRQSNIPLQPIPPKVAYFNVGDFGNATSYDLILEAQLKNDYAEGANACQRTEVCVYFDGGALIMPLAAKGCVSELDFMNMDGKKSDLSILGCDFSDWVNVKIEFKPKQMKVFIQNDSLEFPLKSSEVKMVGVAFKFQGTGSIKHIKVSKSTGEIFFQDDFLRQLPD